MPAAIIRAGKIWGLLFATVYKSPLKNRESCALPCPIEKEQQEVTSNKQRATSAKLALSEALAMIQFVVYLIEEAKKELIRLSGKPVIEQAGESDPGFRSGP